MQCPKPILVTKKTCNFVTFYEFLTHPCMHHTRRWCLGTIVGHPLPSPVMAKMSAAGRTVRHNETVPWQHHWLFLALLHDGNNGSDANNRAQ
jgi:hypothetical protein